MRITERRLRQLIRSVIKEVNMPQQKKTVGGVTKETHGYYFNYLFPGASVKDIVAFLVDQCGLTMQQAEDMYYNTLRMTVSGGSYDGYDGAFFGGMDWNDLSTMSKKEDPGAFKRSDLFSDKVRPVLDSGGGPVAYASQGPGKPPKYAYASQDPKIPPKQLIRQKNKSNCHVLVMYLKGDIHDQLEFEKDTGMNFKSPKYDGNYVVFFLFFKDNECVGYYSEPYSDVSRAEFIAHDWVKNCSSDSFIYNNLIKPASQSNAKRFIALQNSSEKSYISYGKNNQAYYTINQTH